MAFPVSSRTTGDLITAAIWNADLKDNMTTLRAGGIAATNQANGDFLIATSATQLTPTRSFVKVFIEVFG